MNLGQAQLKPVEQDKTPIVIVDDTGAVVRSFGDNVQQFDGPAMFCNAAGTPYSTLKWVAPSGEGVDKRLLDALETFLTPLITDDDFWSIEWRIRPSIERGEGYVQVRCRLVIHKSSNRPAMVASVQAAFDHD